MSDSQTNELNSKGLEAVKLVESNVINWIPVSRTNPPEGETKSYFVRDSMGFMYYRTWKSNFWEGANIIGDYEVTHWTKIPAPTDI